MRPITFECCQVIPKSPAEICSEIADTVRWSEFGGYAILPGIAQADYEHRTDDMVGSRIRVRNKDGSQHVEEIVEWQAGKRVVMKLHDFTPPLSRLASYFLEEWDLADRSDGTLVTRRFQMVPKHSLTRPFLWLISLFFRRAIARHLNEMAV